MLFNIKLNKPIRPAIVVYYHLLPPIRPRNDQVLYSSTETERFMVGETHGRTVTKRRRHRAIAGAPPYANIGGILMGSMAHHI